MLSLCALLAASVFAAPPQPLADLPLAKLSQARAQTWQAARAGGTNFFFAAGFDDEGLLLLARQGDTVRALAPKDWRNGAVLGFPAGSFEFKQAAQGKVLVHGLPSAKEADLELDLGPLLDSAFRRCPHLVLGVVDYAFVREDGAAGLPPSVTLLRRDAQGTLWAAYHTDAELAQMVWILAVDATMYGLRLEGAALAAYAAPVDGWRILDEAFRPVVFP